MKLGIIQRCQGAAVSVQETSGPSRESGMPVETAIVVAQ